MPKRHGVELAPISEEAKEWIALSCRKQAEDDFYFGAICKREHNFGLSGFSLRRRDNDSCVECFRLAGHRFYIENRESHAESQRKYKEANRELIKQRKKEYEIRNRDFLQSEERQKRIKQQQKEWHERNRDSILQKSRERYWANREPVVYTYIELADSGVEHDLKKPELYFLGKLCPQGHDFQSTGYSLKYKSSHRCVECTKENKRTDRTDRSNRGRDVNKNN